MKSVKLVSQLDTRAVLCGTDFVAVRERTDTVIAARVGAGLEMTGSREEKDKPTEEVAYALCIGQRMTT